MKQITFICVALLITFSAESQNVKNNIDGLFAEWSQKNSPGGVVLVARQNKIVFSKAYGLANIPYQILNVEETVFNIGSLSKQFTAMGIVLLQIEGKLSYDDDIKKYLPNFPSFGKPITIRNLLQHTSGLRGTELFALAGWRDGDAISNEDVYRYIMKQKDLNFEAGSEYMYSNTGYILLAKIIENISKQDFKIWTKEKIFQPLQMNSSFVEEDYISIITNTATSYEQIGQNAFKNIENYHLSYGATNVYTTSTDILKWAKNFHDAPNDWKKAFSMLQTVNELTSGQKNNYAFGVIIDDFWGNKRVQHTGQTAGFQSIMYSYPDEKLDIIILSNFSSNQLTNYANKISQLFLQNKLTAKEEEPISPLILSNEVLKQYEGTYWNDKNNFSRKIYVENNVLWYLRGNNKKSPLIPVTETEFQIGGGGITEKLRLKFELNTGKMSMISSDNSIDEFQKYEDKLLTNEELKNYTGSFYSNELDVSYTISMKAGKLYGYNTRFGEFEIQLLKNDVFSWSGFAVSKYKRNANGDIIGLSITINRVRNLWFEKNKM